MKGPVENPQIDGEGNVITTTLAERPNTWEQTDRFEKGIVYYMKDEQV